MALYIWRAICNNRKKAQEDLYMKVMVFDVGGTEIKYSVMDEQLNRTDTGSTPTPADSQEHFLNTLRERSTCPTRTRWTALP